MIVETELDTQLRSRTRSMSAAVVSLADIADSASTTVSKLAVALDDADMLSSNSLMHAYLHHHSARTGFE